MEEWPDISTESLSITHGPKDTCYAQKCNVWDIEWLDISTNIQCSK